MRYDTILFDADETLLDFHRSEYEAVAETMAEVGIEPTEERISTYSQINDRLWKALERGEIEKSVLLWKRFLLFREQFGIGGTEEDAREMAARYMKHLSEKGYLLDGALSLLQRLKGKVRMYIVTNGVAFIQRGRYKLSGLESYPDGVFISEEVGAEKPSPAYFSYVAEHIPDFCRERTLVVGDSLTSDIKGGVNFGLDTCWFNPHGKAVSEELRGRITYTVSSHEEIYRLIMEENA
jgi:2-haloacid dehalogenase